MTGEEREHEGLRRENTGLTSQRIAAIKDRWPRWMFSTERAGADGSVLRLNWHQVWSHV